MVDDFENLGFLSKIWFCVFWEATGHSGSLDILVFWVFYRFCFFCFLVFFWFFDSLKNLTGGYGAVLVGVSRM